MPVSWIKPHIRKLKQINLHPPRSWSWSLPHAVPKLPCPHQNIRWDQSHNKDTRYGCDSLPFPVSPITESDESGLWWLNYTSDNITVYKWFADKKHKWIIQFYPFQVLAVCMRPLLCWLLPESQPLLPQLQGLYRHLRLLGGNNIDTLIRPLDGGHQSERGGIKTRMSSMC